MSDTLYIKPDKEKTYSVNSEEELNYYKSLRPVRHWSRTHFKCKCSKCHEIKDILLLNLKFPFICSKCKIILAVFTSSVSSCETYIIGLFVLLMKFSSHSSVSISKSLVGSSKNKISYSFNNNFKILILTFSPPENVPIFCANIPSFKSINSKYLYRLLYKNNKYT